MLKLWFEIKCKCWCKWDDSGHCCGDKVLDMNITTSFHLLYRLSKYQDHKYDLGQWPQWLQSPLWDTESRVNGCNGVWGYKVCHHYDSPGAAHNLRQFPDSACQHSHSTNIIIQAVLENVVIIYCRDGVKQDINFGDTMQNTIWDSDWDNLCSCSFCQELYCEARNIVLLKNVGVRRSQVYQSKWTKWLLLASYLLAVVAPQSYNPSQNLHWGDKAREKAQQCWPAAGVMKGEETRKFASI